MCLICVECRPPELENKIITSEMLSNIEKRDWNESFKGGQNELWQWGHWVMSKWCLLCCHRDGCRLMRIPHALFCMLFSTFILMITDYINKLTSCRFWSTSRYGVPRDLPTLGHTLNKGRSLETLKTSLVPWLLLPPTHWDVSLRCPWTIPE